MKRTYPEYELQKQCKQYLDLQYKNVLYDSDTIASIKLTAPQQGRNKAIQKEGFKRPDIVIYTPNFYYHGLFIELKVKSPFKKDGTLLKNDHLEGQQNTINDLSKLGYKAMFCTGFEEFKIAVDEYLLHVDALNLLI